MNMATFCIASLLALGVLFSYVLLHGTGWWVRCHWCGKLCLLMLAGMACQSGWRVRSEPMQRDDRLTAAEARVFADIESQFVRMTRDGTEESDIR